MGKVYTPQNVGSGVQTTTTLNQNFTDIETALQDVLSRSGVAPNAMAANLDLGNNNILNGNTGNFVDIVVGGTSIVAQVTAAAASAAAALASEIAAGISESNAGTSESNASASATLASQWATLTGGLVAATDYSSKEYAVGTFIRGLANGGSAKDWASLTGAVVDASNEVSAREWARGTYNVGLANGGSARMWATRTGATADDTEYSAKEYAIGTTVASGSAKDWAQEAEDVLVDGSGYSAFHWAQKAMAIVGGVAGLVSSNDTTADYLVNKFTALHGLAWTEINDGGNEDLQISVGSHLEIGGGANVYPLNIYKNDSSFCAAWFTNLTTGNLSGDGFTVGINASEQAQFWNYENTDMLFGLNNDEKMRVTAANGNLLFDTTADAAGYRIRCHDAATSGAQYIRFGNTTTGTLTSRGIVVGMNASEEMVLQNLENTAMRFYTNNAERWVIAASGGLYANLATGGDQGNGTINADGEIFVDGRSISGALPTTSNKYRRTSAKFVVDYGFDPAGIITAIDLGTLWTKNAWESFGPTGSGATNIVADLDVVNDMGACTAYEFSVQLSGIANTATAYFQTVDYTMDAAHVSQVTVGSHGSYNGSGSGASVRGMGMGGTFGANDTGVGEIKWNSSNCTSESIFLIIHAIHEGEGN